MYKNVLKFIALAMVLMSFQCEEDEVICNTAEASLVNDAGILFLTPLQETYNEGDVLTLKVTLPSSNTIFGAEEDIFETSQDLTAILSFPGQGILTENMIEFIRGGQGPDLNTLTLNYNQDTDAYELEATITLNRLGAYSQSKRGFIDIGLSIDDCIEYTLVSDIAGVEGPTLEFTVQ